MNLLYIKALHIIFVVTWFAGLFYLVRLFIYHLESNQKPEPERSILIAHFKKAESRLWYGITWPSAIGTYIFGFWLAFSIYGSGFPGWLVLKLAFVLGLTWYHLQCGLILSRLKNGTPVSNGFKMRVFNEVATVILVSVIFIVVLKDTGNWLWGLLGLAIFSGLLLVAIFIYKKLREKAENGNGRNS